MSSQPHEVAYESWNVIALRAELLRRKVYLRGLTRKAQYVSRLKELDERASQTGTGLRRGKVVQPSEQFEEIPENTFSGVHTQAKGDNISSRESTAGFEPLPQQPRAPAATTAVSSQLLPDDGDESDYGMSSCDEAELEFIASQVESSPCKRPAEAIESTPAKRQRLPLGDLSTNQTLRANNGITFEPGFLKAPGSSFPPPSSQNMYSSQQSYIPDSVKAKTVPCLYRSNVHVYGHTVTNQAAKVAWVVNYLVQHPGSAVVCTKLASQAEELANALRLKGVLAMSTHPRMDFAVRTRLEEQFMQSETMVWVITNDFEVHSDNTLAKTNIRTFIIFDMLDNVEDYVDPVVAIGQDGNPGYCHILLSHQNVLTNERMIRGSVPSKECLEKFIYDLCSTAATHRVNSTFELDLRAKSAQFDITIQALELVLEQLGGPERSLQREYGHHQWKVLNRQKRNAVKSPEAIALMAATGQLAKNIKLNIDVAAQRHDLPAADIMSKLEEWHDRGVIELERGDAKAVFRVLKPLPTATADIKLLIPVVYRALQDYESDELQKMKDIMSFLTDRGCLITRLSQFAADSDEHSDTDFECGNFPPTPSWDRELFGKVLTAIGARDDARFLAFVAFGVESPRVVREGLNRPGTVFGSMAQHDFDKLYNAFVKCCSQTSQRDYHFTSTQGASAYTPSPSRSKTSRPPSTTPTRRKGSASATGRQATSTASEKSSSKRSYTPRSHFTGWGAGRRELPVYSPKWWAAEKAARERGKMRLY